jgi:hypothetical protein
MEKEGARRNCNKVGRNDRRNSLIF